MTGEEGWKVYKHVNILLTAGLMLCMLLGLLAIMALTGNLGGVWFALVLIPCAFLFICLMSWWDERRTWNTVYKEFGTDLDRVSEGIARALTDRGTGFSRRDGMRPITGPDETLVLDQGGLEITVHKMTIVRVFIGPLTEYNRTEVTALSRLVDEALTEG